MLPLRHRAPRTSRRLPQLRQSHPARRGIDYSFGASTFWLWGILGSIIVVGPFIYTYKLLKSMNLLAADYNAKG